MKLLVFSASFIYRLLGAAEDQQLMWLSHNPEAAGSSPGLDRKGMYRNHLNFQFVLKKSKVLQENFGS